MNFFFQIACKSDFNNQPSKPFHLAFPEQTHTLSRGNLTTETVTTETVKYIQQFYPNTTTGIFQ